MLHSIQSLFTTSQSKEVEEEQTASVSYQGYLYAAWNSMFMFKDLISGGNPLNVFKEALSQGDGTFHPYAKVDVLALNGFSLKKKTYVVITDTELGMKMLREANNQSDGIYSGGEIFEKTKEVAGEANIITLPADRHVKLAKFAGPFFQTSKARSYKESYRMLAQEMIRSWTGESEVNASQALPIYSSKSIAKALLHYDSNETLPQLINMMTEKLFKGMHGIPDMPLAWQKDFLGGKNTLNEIVEEVYQISSKVENYQKGDDSFSFITHMIHHEENGQTVFTKQEVVDMIKVVFIGGQETTATLLTESLYFLCKYPQWQKKLRDEIYSRKKAIEKGQFEKLTLLRCFMSEVLRLHPPAYGQARELAKPFDFLEEGQELSAGTTLLFLHLYSQTDAERWEDPLKFNPYRFEGGPIQKLPYLFPVGRGHTDSKLLPFGRGPNVCLGRRYAEEMAIVFLLTLIKSSKIEFAKPNNGDVRMGFMLNLKEDLHIKVTGRQRNNRRSQHTSRK